MVLLVLKIFYGQGRVGCAAGGDVVEVRQLKKVENLTKKERKQRILRNWRVQTTCLLACISMLPISVVMLQLGLNPFIASLDDIREINDEVDSRAFRGIEIITQLQDTIGNLQSLPTSGLLKHTFTQEKLCPNQDIADALNSTIDLKTLLNLVTTTWKDNVTAGVSLADSIIQRYDLESVAGTLHKVTNTTASVAEGINSMYSNNWILKLLVVIMDLVVIFLIIGILFTKDNTDFPAYQRFTSLLLLPLFCLTLIATVAGTCFFVSMAMANAGACHLFYYY